MRVISSLLLSFFLGLCALAQSPINMTNLKIRVERPDRIREPASPGGSNCYDGKDNYFNEVQTGTSTFMGYSANGSKTSTIASTCRIQGTQPADMSGSVTQTIYPTTHYPGAPSYGSCGLWLNGSYITRNGDGTINTIYGFAHAETACSYPATTKSMAMLTSNDGQNWSLVSQIIANPSNVHANSDSGEGDCTPVVFNNHVQLYCRRATVGTSTVGRSPLTNCTPIFSPGCWRKWNGPTSGWSSLWNADDADLTTAASTGHTNPSNRFGSSASIWTTTNNVVLLNASVAKASGAPNYCSDPTVTSVGGVKISFSWNSDGSGFDMLNEPILCEDDHLFDTASTFGDLIVYPSAINPADGSQNWTNSFELSYQYVPNTLESKNTGDVNERTLVMRQVSASIETNQQTPHVGVAISRWYNSTADQRISSVQAVPSNLAGTALNYEVKNGYTMTVPPDPSVDSNPRAVVECISTSGGANPEHLMTFKTNGQLPTECNGTGHVFLRSAGWLYSVSTVPNTQAVYRCHAGSNGTYHYTSLQSDCEVGAIPSAVKDFTLGYALSN